MNPTLELMSELGVRVRTPILLEPSDAMDPALVDRAVLATLRRYALLGYHLADIPAGGITLPMANEESFDWSLLGASRVSHSEKGEGVYHAGHFYTRRHLPANERKKMPEVIKYSRGSKATDPPHVVEESSDFAYVTLIRFIGSRPSIAKYSAPTDSVLTDLPESAPNRQALTDFVRNTYHSIGESTTAELGGSETVIRAFIQENWNSIRAQFPRLLEVARAIESTTNIPFIPPASPNA